MKVFDIAILGGGASGMTAAITALNKNKIVFLIETNERIGKKILATGNGKCNFSHEPVCIEDYHCDDQELVKSILERFHAKDAISFFESLGMLSKNKNGYLYPASEQASTVLDLLRLKLQEMGCSICCGAHHTTVHKNAEGFFVIHVSGAEYMAKALIIATGSRAGGTLEQKDENPYAVAESFQIKRTKLYPALTKCICKENFYKQVAGVRAEAEVSIFEQGRFATSEKGELQLTAQGISGIVVFQMAGYIAESLAGGKQITAHINLIPYIEQSEISSMIEKRYELFQNRTAEDFFLGLLHKKLIYLLLKINHIGPEQKISALSKRRLIEVMECAADFRTEIISVADLKDAQVCRGGLLCSEFKRNLESAKAQGVFACGEVLNVDGKCGGYNLHFAWASGYIAGESASDYVELRE